VTDFNINNHQKVATEAQELLLSPTHTTDWNSRYQKYAQSISSNLESIKANRRRLRQWQPFKFYLNTTNAQNAKSILRFDIRYLGQTVAELIIKGERIAITTKPNKTRNYEETNLRDFDCQIRLTETDWDSKEAHAFRSHFRKRDATRNKADSNKGNEEHRIESLLLSEFSKSKDKILPNIKPVTIGSIRFPMPTPISASKQGTIKYSKERGGGIDILARVGTGGRWGTYLCVIEVKDENVPSEPASHAIEQAIKYSVFMRELLRSDAGADWWKLLGLGDIVPDKLLIHAVCAMPDIPNADVSFAGQKVQVGNDEIQLDYIYFTETDNKIDSVRTSLSYGKQTEVSK
jgi:hypothetical protein